MGGGLSPDTLELVGVSKREREVIAALAEQLSNAEIAREFGISERTVESHVSSLLRKLGVRTRRQLGAFAAGAGVGAGPTELPSVLRRRCEDGVMFGRQAEMDAVLTQWATLADVRLTMVRGEPGMGKSRLAAELAGEISRRGGTVAVGACTEGAQRPFEPFVAALSSIGVTLEHDPLLARLVVLTGHGMDTIVDRERDRFDVQKALIDTLLDVAEPDGLLLVIEDLHWASGVTRETVELLVHTARKSRLLVIATTRDGHSDVRHAAFLGRIARSPGVSMLALAGLDVGAATELIAAEQSTLDPADGVSRTGGNPLFLRELARHGASSRSLGEAVANLFTRLDPAELQLFDIAVIGGDPIDAAILAAAAGRRHDDVLDTLERAEAIGIIVGGGRPGQFVFTHDVFRSGREAMLTSAHRMRLHASLATALDRRDLPPQLVPTVARHARLAGARFDARRRAELSRQAGDLAMRAVDHASAAEHYRTALESTDGDTTVQPRDRLELTIAYGEALMLSGQRSGEAVLRTVVQDATAQADPVAAAAALAAMTQVPGGQSATVLGEEFELMLTSTLDALPMTETGWRVRLLGNLGTRAYFHHNDTARADALLEEAVRLASATGDPVTLGRALLFYRWAGGQWRMDQRIACGHELIELGERTGQDVFSLVGCQQLAWCHGQLGDRVGLARWHDAAARLTHGPDLEQLVTELSIAILDGKLGAADGLVRDMIAIEGRNGDYAPAGRFCLDDLRGRLLPPDVIEARMNAAPTQRWWWEPHLVRALARTNQTARAANALAAIRIRGYGRPESHMWTSALSCFAESAMLCGHTDVAVDVADLLEPLSGGWIHNGVVVVDTVDRTRSLCLLAVCDAAAAAELAHAAAEASTRRHTPILRARELVVACRAVRDLGRPIDTALVAEALTISRRTGARIIEDDARLLLGTTKVDDQDGLTMREREILEHVAIGETNRQIAHALHVSEATVRKHLESAFRKLHVSTRTAAVARLHRTKSDLAN